MYSICRCSSSRIRRFSSSEMFAAAALLADDRELIAVATLAGLVEGFNIKVNYWTNKYTTKDHAEPIFHDFKYLSNSLTISYNR